MPGIGEMYVVRRNDTLVESGGAERVELKISAAPAVHYLGLVYDAHYFVKHNWVARVCSRSVRNLVGVSVGVRAAHLVDDRGIDADAVIVAPVVQELAHV